MEFLATKHSVDGFINIHFHFNRRANVGMSICVERKMERKGIFDMLINNMKRVTIVSSNRPPRSNARSIISKRLLVPKLEISSDLSRKVTDWLTKKLKCCLIDHIRP